MSSKVIDGVFTLTKRLGQGSMSVVMLAEADLEAFDYTTLYAYTQVQGSNHIDRRQKAENLAESLRGKPLDPQTMRTILSAQGIPIPDKSVAIKIATQEGYTPRFEGEWKNLLCLSHPNLVEVYGGNVYLGQPYYVMQVLNNIVPVKTIKEEFTIEERLNIILQAAKGLQCLHDNSIIHRDIKPNNVATCKLESGGYITKVTDLGLAKNLEENLGLTQPKMLLGSPAYMPPEQISAPADVDHRADIYSLGATMYELISGEYPYFNKKSPYDVIMAISTDEPMTPISELCPGIPSQLCAIVQTATAFDLSDRYRTIEDMAADIQTYLDREDAAIKTSLQFSEELRHNSKDTLAQGEYNFSEMLKVQENSLAVIPVNTAENNEKQELDSLKMLVVNRKHTQHVVFSRCADALGMSYKGVKNLSEAEDTLNNEKIDVAVFTYQQRDPATIRLCVVARKKKVPFLLHGDALNKNDILCAARMGASAMMLNPIKEEHFTKKIRMILSGAGEPPPEKQRKVTTILFKDKKSAPERARAVAKNVSNLLVLPHAAAKVTALCNNPNASAEELAIPIRSDSAIAALVLRRANSAALGGSRKITTIRDAVVRIGRRETRQLAITVAVYKLFDRKEKSFGFNRYMYWIHALGSAVVAKLLSSRIKGITEEDAFLCGLLHDLGKIVFDDHLNEDFHHVLTRASADHLRMAAAEQEIFAMDHAFLGARVGEKWNIPRHITEAIEGHHKWNNSSKGDILKLPPEAITSLANSIIKAIGSGHSGDFYVDDVRLKPEDWNRLLGSLQSIPRYCKAIIKELKEFAEFLGIGTKDSGLDEISEEKERMVRIIPDGIGVLLGFFFASRGFNIHFITWEDFSNHKDDIACDGRLMPAAVYQSLFEPMAFWKRHVFVLGVEIKDAPEESIHCVTPANDFFKLDQICRDAYEEID